MVTRGRTILVVCCLCLAGATVGLTAAGQVDSLAPVGGGSTTDTGPTGAQNEAPTTDNTVTRVRLHRNGTATWTVQVRSRLRTDDDVTEFERVQASFRNDSTDSLDRFDERMTGVVAAAANGTGRDMTARGFTVSTGIQEVPRRWGVVTYEFVWDDFARTDGEDVVVGDVFQQGFFLAANDTLVLEAPDGYEVDRVEPASGTVRNGTITWVGPVNFADERPHARFVRDQRPGDATRKGDDELLSSAAFLVGGALLVVAVLAAGYTLASGRGWRHWGRTGDATTGADGTTQSDEDRIAALLAENGGRMTQGDVDDAFEWSKAKTSRLLSRMAEEGAVEKVQLGRENVVELTDEDGEDDA
jgi:uncharacterized membrane protein